MSFNEFPLPADLPVPVDDGAADHLLGARLPSVTLEATSGAVIDLGKLTGWWVIYIYPMTGRPGVALPDGWDAISGARGCTPQSCGFRDHYEELKRVGASVIGLSTQSSAYQREARERLHLPFELVSDSNLQLKKLLKLPTFTVSDRELFKRLTLITKSGNIEKLFYPVFPPDQNADQVMQWFQSQG